MSKIPDLVPMGRGNNVEAMAHDGNDLHVRFAGKPDVYTYQAVPAKVHQQLLDADSVGSAFHRLVRGKYAFSKSGPDKP